MSNKWNNEKRLSTLGAEFKDGVLTFSAGDEKAEVYLDGNNIKKVVYSNAGKETVLGEKDCEAIVVGENNWQRDVYHYLKPKGPAPHMRLGITKHRGVATWSSLPHDFELNTEAGFEEIFFYILEGGPKKAVQVGKGVWFDNTPVDSAWLVEDKSFGVVPMGYHPIAGLPGVTVSYVWVYLAKKKEWEKVK
ncbi:MAG TPA: 5-deoxy-glucuronate isomerase [Candidatus Paceibacterota bacterium]